MAKLPAAGLDYDTMVNNLVSHYHGSNDDEKKSGRLWYRVAHNLFGKMGEDAGVGHDRAVAVGSATSPNTDWNENIKHAGNMLMHYRPNDPDHNEHDWQMAHIHPQARADFQAQTGRDPTHSDEDLHALADLHAPHFARGKARDATNDLSNPDARANWMASIQHHGMDTVLGDHEKQVFDNRRKTDAAGNVVGYQPQDAMRHIMRRDLGSGTLSSNVKKAKDIIRAEGTDPAEFHRILGGPKTGNFSSNILDPTEMDEEGYLKHPNGDWTQHEDLGGTIDAHHLRASTMANGEWQRKGYRDKSSKLNPSDPYTYDVYNRGLLDATRKVNSSIQNPDKHITPKQLQAIVWLKHKNDNDRFKKLPINHESEITPDMLEPGYVRPKAVKPPRAAAFTPESFADMPPLWRKMFMSRVMPEWTDLLDSWVHHYSPEPGEDDGAIHREEPPEDRDPHLAAYYPDTPSVEQVLAYSAAVVKNTDFGPEWQRNVMKDVNETGGFTRRGPEGPPSTGFMVSLPGHERTQPREEVSGESIADYGREHWPQMEHDPDLYQGGWEEEGDPSFYHDISRHHDDIWDAAKAAYGETPEEAQHAFYDINTGVSPSPLELVRNGEPGLTMAKKEEVDDWLTWT